MIKKYLPNEYPGLIDELMRRDAVLNEKVKNLERIIQNQGAVAPLPRLDPTTYPEPYEGQRGIDVADEQHTWYSDGTWRKPTAGGIPIWFVTLNQNQDGLGFGPEAIDWTGAAESGSWPDGSWEIDGNGNIQINEGGFYSITFETSGFVAGTDEVINAEEQISSTQQNWWSTNKSGSGNQVRAYAKQLIRANEAGNYNIPGVAPFQVETFLALDDADAPVVFSTELTYVKDGFSDEYPAASFPNFNSYVIIVGWGNFLPF